MKKQYFLFYLLFLTACSASSPAVPANASPAASAEITMETAEERITEKTQAPQTEEQIPEFPPALTVVHGETSITALQGTSSWTYQTGEESLSVCADSIHPLQAKDRMPFLSTSGAERVSLIWDLPPDQVFVRCYDSSAWGTDNAQSTSIPVMILQICSDKEEDPEFMIELNEDEHIYEIIAEWNRSEYWGGSSCYSFYTKNH